MIDRFNETMNELLSRHGGNYTALAKALDNVVDRAYLSMLLRKKRGKPGKPPIALVEKVKEKFGVDPMTGKKVVSNVTPMVEEPAPQYDRMAAAYDKIAELFSKSMEATQSTIEDLRNDKRQMAERETWLRQHIDRLTMGFNSIKEA